eukprot:TRINITY_DN55649_c0_g1_i1.p1 TRINITY_DN55649_c0_g1~~TRINITY_DN55649_c0_g1_i1.p1  ORF type:complete len:313 (+),score=61.71 TRINITY_DN55649_c0_g1_i1:122-1060(+)
MLHFTPQQLMGGSASRTGVRLGNWFEDEALSVEKARLQRRQIEQAKTAAPGVGMSGCISGATARILAKVRNHSQTDRLTPFRASEVVHFGDRVVLQCASHGGSLACDLDDRISPPPALKLRLTATKTESPSARFVFVIERVVAPLPSLDERRWLAAGEGDILHFNQPFHLRLSELVDLPPDAAGPLFVASSVHETTLTSRDQGVFLADRGSTDLQWVAEAVDVSSRRDLDGQWVPQNAAVILRHGASRKPLASQPNLTFRNDFGVESEVMCARFAATASRKPGAQEMAPNMWAFISGPPSRETAAAAAGAPA